MDRYEAERITQEIHDHIGSIRSKLLYMQDNGGWSALGYSSMHTYMIAEFRLSKSQMYRELEAGNIERIIDPDSPLGEKPERHMRELATLKDPVLIIAAATAADEAAKITGEPLTASLYKQAAESVREVVITKGHVTLEGESVSILGASVAEAYLEKVSRHIAHRKSTLEKPIFNESGLPGELLPKLRESLQNQGDSVRIVVYRVRGENISAR